MTSNSTRPITPRQFFGRSAEETEAKIRDLLAEDLIRRYPNRRIEDISQEEIHASITASLDEIRRSLPWYARWYVALRMVHLDFTRGKAKKESHA